MAKFDLAFLEIMKRETPWRSNGGKITFIPKITSDTGGVTKWGISQKSYPDLNVQDLTFDDARLLYVSRWNESKAGLIVNQKSANIYFDHAVNRGITGAIKVLYNALTWLGAALTPTSSIEDIVAQANRYPTNLPGAIAKFRKLDYEKLVKGNPKKYGLYADAWEARVNSFFTHLPPK
jgi:lysozyme family protein